MSDFGFRYHRVRDPDLVANRSIDRSVLRRVWRFARPYRLMLAILLATILLASLFAILPPLVFRAIIDNHAIPRRDLGGINNLALLALMLAVLDAVMGVVQRWLSAAHRRGPHLRPARRPSTTTCSACRCRSSPAPRPVPSSAG